jgi:ubiquitin-conjugating enzyme E2 Z
MSTKNDVTISKDTISRLIKDITYIRKNPLISDGIYYSHHESDMLKGYAMIIGPSDTPYFGGYYLFEFHFPSDYPYSPPKLVYLTNRNSIRFNPNLYTNGKVCISILNTWHGEKWSSCQSIHSVLLTLCTILNNNPLLNEPGTALNHPDINKYNDIITFSNISIAVCDVINNKIPLPLPCIDVFYPVMKEKFLENYEKLLAVVENNIKKNNTNVTVSIGLYHLRVFIDYEMLKLTLMETKLSLLKEKHNELKNVQSESNN